ncbi:MAG TPA: hypothetical protein VFI28_00475, partial [Candidatus Limnocylindrales bacterium]|nr:hypothetical protein [Candidatus Limnocylindrales bacterium]
MRRSATSPDTPSVARVAAVEESPPSSQRLLIATVFSIYAIAVANTTSGAVAQPAIAAAFGAGTGDVGWVVFGY